MFARSRVVALFAACLALLVPYSQRAAAADDDAAAMRLVLLDSSGPLQFDLAIELDGRPAADAPAEPDRRMARLFAWLDANDDGAVTLDEAERMPPPVLLLPAVRVGETADIVGFAAAAALCDGDGDGRITVEELAAFHRLVEGPAFGVQADVTPDLQNERLSQLVFSRLDADSDRLLSAAEVDAAAERLAELDQDDNQVISLDELGGAVAEGELVAVETAAPSNRVRTGLAAFRRGDEARAARDIIALVNSARGSSARGAIRLAEARWTDERAARLDADGDGRLDSKELEAYLRGPADGALRVRLGEAAGKPVLEFKARTDDDKTESRPGVGVLTIASGGGQLIVHALDSGPGPAAETFDSRLKAALAAADLDGDKRLSAEEQAGSTLARAARFMDRDRDGQLDEEESLRYAADVALPRQAAVAERVTLILAPRRVGLFQLLDANQDGRLGMREVRVAADILRSADGDGDGKLKPGESPAVFRLAVARGATAMFGKSEDQLPPQTDENEPFSYASPGPPWFRKMDRNRDGDVTPREFLGSLDRFDELDQDGDGLLSGQEALRWQEEG